MLDVLEQAKDIVRRNPPDAAEQLEALKATADPMDAILIDTLFEALEVEDVNPGV